MRPRLRRAWPAALAGPLLAVAGCATTAPHVESSIIDIAQVQVRGAPAQATQLLLVLDACVPGHRAPYVVRAQESFVSVDVLVTGPMWTGSVQADCAELVTLKLKAPLGDRSVIDDFMNRPVRVVSS